MARPPISSCRKSNRTWNTAIGRNYCDGETTSRHRQRRANPDGELQWRLQPCARNQIGQSNHCRRIEVGSPPTRTGGRGIYMGGVLSAGLYAMDARGARRGLASLCIGGGEALAMIIERI